MTSEHFKKMDDSPKIFCVPLTYLYTSLLLIMLLTKRISLIFKHIQTRVSAARSKVVHLYHLWIWTFNPQLSAVRIILLNTAWSKLILQKISHL